MCLLNNGLNPRCGVDLQRLTRCIGRALAVLALAAGLVVLAFFAAKYLRAVGPGAGRFAAGIFKNCCNKSDGQTPLVWSH